MVCIFCKSDKHLPQNCDEYVTNADRKDILFQMNYCPNCLYKYGSHEYPVYQCCVRCGFYQKCYICFSKAHHTVFCPDRVKALYLFLPNIDQNLLPRFINMLAVEEKYFMIFTFPTVSNYIKIKPLKVKCRKVEEIIESRTFSNVDFVIADKCIYNIRNTTENIVSLPLESISFRIKHLEIFPPLRDCLRLSSLNLLQLLSPKTKILKCGKVTFHPKKCLHEILKKAPNLQNIEIHQTNIETDGTWPNQLMEVTHLETIHLPITDINFDVESLATFMKTKSVNILLYIIIPPKTNSVDEKSFTKIIEAKLSNYFTPFVYQRKSVLTISLIYKGEASYEHSTQKYEPKNVFDVE